MKIRRTWALLALMALVAVSACGSSRSEEDAGARDTGTEPAEASAASDITFGTVETPCGDGDASTASDVGVTADEIAIGYGDDAGFPGAPGLTHEIGDAMEAIISWCNDHGGINGRKIKGNYYDGKITEVNNAMTRACQDENFMLVGEGYALDAGQEETRLGCGLPAVPTYTVSPEFANAQLMYAALPNPVDFQAVTHAKWFAENYPKEAKKVATLYANFSATADSKDKTLSTWPKVGIEFLDCHIPYAITGESDWKPLIQKLKDCGAEAVEFQGSPEPMFEQILEAAEQLEFRPWWLAEANIYADNFAKWNTGGLADKVIVRSQDVPFELAEFDPATQAYLDLLEEYGGDRSSLGLHAVSAFLLWATQAKACGDDLTRTCVLEKLAEVEEWDGGGMAGPANVSENLPSSCEVILTLEKTEWKQLVPEKGGELFCDDDNVQQVEGPIVDKLNLGPDRRIPKA